MEKRILARKKSTVMLYYGHLYSFRSQLNTSLPKWNLGCPFTDSVDESWISELIFRPGEPRIRLLNWLFSKFDSKLADTLDPQLASTETKMDSRIQRLLYVASTMGLCRSDDADLIRGLASISKQGSFMEQLLNIVCIADAAEDPRKQMYQSPNRVSDSMSLEDQLCQDCILVDQLATQERMDSLFTSRAKLLPPDIHKQIMVNWEDKGYKDPDKPPMPDVNQLLQKAVRTAEDLHKQNEILSELRNKLKYQECDKQEVSKCGKRMQLVLSDLSQLMVGFSYCYGNEMQQWCNRTPPVLNDLGQMFKRVHTLLQQFTALLDGMCDVKSSFLSVCSATQGEPLPISRNTTLSGLASVSMSYMESCQSCIDILDESVHRHGSGDCTLSSALNASMVKL